MNETKYEIKVQQINVINKTLLRDIDIEGYLKQITQNIKRKLKSDQKYYLSIELGSGQIKKKFLKSGFFKIQDYLKAIYLISSELEQILQSSDSLYFDDTFLISIFVFKSVQPAGCLTWLSESKRNFNRSFQSRSVLKEIGSLPDMNSHFLNAIRFGSFDLSAFYLQTENCIEVTE